MTTTRPALPPLPIALEADRPSWMRPGTYTVRELASLPGTYEAFEVAAGEAYEAAWETTRAAGEAAGEWMQPPFTAPREDGLGRYEVISEIWHTDWSGLDVTSYSEPWRTDAGPWEHVGESVVDRWFLGTLDADCHCGCHTAEPPF